MARPKLHYFDFNGLAEGIRFILHYGNVDFEDVRYSHADWEQKKTTFQFGQLPIYEVPGKGTLNQSLAIARYLGQTLKLTTGDAWKDAQLDALILTVYDFWKNLKDVVMAPTDKEAAKKKLLTETLPYYFSKFDKQISENNGFFGGKLTWVDFVFVGLIETGNLFLKLNLQDNYPAITELFNRIHAYPGVKKYVDTRKPYVNPFDN